ncbi:MAG: metallophosphoesterase [Akkermansia sp.]|nr:metallophosphoesterase [Akkermansia sp.]
MRTVFIVYAVLMLYIALRVGLATPKRSGGGGPLRVKWAWKVPMLLLLALGAFKFSILDWVNPGGRYFAPEVDARILLPLTWLNIFVILLGILLLLAELPRAAGWLFVRGRFRNAVNMSLAALAGIATTVGMCNALAMPQVHRVDISLPGMPADAKPVTLALLADLHADTVKREPYFRALVEQVNALGADTIAICGDFVDGTVADHGSDLEPLADLRAPLGVFGVPGNHDYPSGYADWMEYFARRGIRMLPNAHAVLGRGVVLAGVTDPAATWQQQEEAPDLGKALQGAPAGLPVVLLAHQPSVAPQTARDGRVALQLSGHTHGGMFPVLSNIVSKYNGGYLEGLYQVDGMQLYVTPGTSLWSGMLIRLFHPAEITLITLHP